MVSRKADHCRHNYECMHKPTNYEITNSGIEEEREVEDKAKAAHKEKVRVVIASIIASD
ncbi:MAG: hypothetical protein ACRD6Q_03080 [Nitrososphaeraceae archaeon]